MPVKVAYGRLGVVTGLQILGGRYRLEEPVGVGGMSVVWKATDEVLRRSVAVKILAGDFTFDHARTAVLAEAQAVAQLSHPNVCNVFDYGESLQQDGRMVPYIVMELLAGPSLLDRLKQGPVPPKEALKIAAEIASGLAAAHGHGVVHRDVKPGNVILTAGGAKVIDFGIAASEGSPEARPDGTIVATPSFVAPERLLGGMVLPPSDMFSFGVLLFHLLTGAPPWAPWVPVADRLSTVARMPDIPGVPPQIADLYLSCLAEHPDDRPTAAAAAAVLLVALTVRTPETSDVLPARGVPDRDADSVTIRAIADADRRRRRRRAVVFAVGLVAVLASLGFALSTNNGNSQGVLGSGPSKGPASPTDTLPGDMPVVGTPGREVPVRGGPAVTVTVTVYINGNQAPIGPASSFRTKGGTVLAACDTYGPRLVSVDAAPGFYPNQASLILAAFVFFTKPAAGTDPTITYRVTITCSGSGAEPDATVASYLGDKLVTPTPSASTSPATTTSAAPKSP
jgi:serine/threonine-protein kinase